MNLKTLAAIVTLVWAGNQKGFSQIEPKTIRVSFYNEALSLPSLKLLRKPIHPAVTLGADFWVKPGKHWQSSAGADLTFYHHRLSENALMLDAVFTQGYKFNFGLQPKILVSVGYKHSFLPGDVYTFENGAYKKAPDRGVAQLNVKLGLGFEFAINDKFSVTTDYKFMVAAPYSEALPFSTHTFIGLGLKVNLAAATQGEEK